MRLIELYAEEFGCLVDRRFSFGEGLRIIEGANESGKSTVMALLRFLFYGFPRRGSEAVGERERRLSRKGRRAAGRVIFLWQGEEIVLCRDYVLRSSGGKETPIERLQVFARATGTAVALGGVSAGEYFLGLPLALYESSACVRQSEIDEISQGQTGDAVSEFLFLGAGGARLERAEKALDEARRALQYNRGTGGRIAALQGEQQACAAAYAEATQNAARALALGEEKREWEKQLASATKALTRLGESQEAARLAAELKHYDAWHAAIADEEAAAAALQKATDAVQAELPAEGAVQAATAALDRCREAADKRYLAEREREAAAREHARHTKAQTVCALGGAAAVERQLNGLQKYARMLGTAAILAVVLALLCLGAAFLLPSRPVLLLVAFFSFVLMSLLLFGLRLLSKKALSRLALQVGISDPLLLRTHFVNMREEESLYVAAENALAQADAAFGEADRLCRHAYQELQAAFAAVGITFAKGEDPAPLLAELMARRREATARCDAEKMKLEKAKGVRTVLENGLDPAAEQDLRAALAALPDTGVPREDAMSLQRELEGEIGAAQERLRALEREEADCLAKGASPVTLQESLLRVERELAQAHQRLAALKMAAEALHEADATLREGVLPTLATRASDILARLTRGACGRLHVSKDFVAFIETDDGLYPLAHSSAGARDVAYFALRLALLDLITDEPLPLLLDEVCARLDDTRAAQLLDFLAAYCEDGAQCLLFTCHTREARLLGNRPYRHISLSEE